MSKKLTEVWIGDTAYLSKPAKYVFTLVYSDSTKERMVTTYESGEHIAKENGLAVTNPPTGHCFCDSDDSCSCDDQSSSSASEELPSIRKKGPVVSKKEKTKNKQQRRKFVADDQ